MKPTRAIPLAGLAIVLLAAVAIVASTRPTGPGPGEARVKVDGSATVARASGRVSVVRASSVFLHRGDSITLTTGTADFELADGVRYQAVHHDGRRNPRVTMGIRSMLDAGELLVTTSPASLHDPQLSAGRTTVAVVRSPGGSAVRVDQTYALSVGVYRGAAHVDSAGAIGEVSALRRLDVPALGQVNRESRPLQADPADRWDRRFLGTAIAIDQQLAPVLAGWTRSGGGGWTVGQLHGALPGQPSTRQLASLVSPQRSGGETMVVAAIAGLGHRGTYAERWSEIFTFHDAGASWGLVAMDQGVSTSALMAAVSTPIDATPFPYPDGVTAVSYARPADAVTNQQMPVVTGAGGGPIPTSGAGDIVTGVTASGGTGSAPTVANGAQSGSSKASAGGGPEGSVPQTPPVVTPPTSGGVAASPIGGGVAHPSPLPASSIPTPPAPVRPTPAPPSSIPVLPLPPVDVVPPIKLPGVTVPGIQVPPVQLPPLPVPPVQLPPLPVPPVQLPPLAVPPVQLPPLAVPPVQLPPLHVQLPAVQVPLVQLPPIQVPAVQLPPIQVPAVQVPPVQVPAVQVPAVPVPVL